MTAFSINLDDINKDRLIQMLEDLESTKKALSRLLHTSEAERTLFIQDASILQSVYLQLLGITYHPSMGQPDWSGNPSDQLGAEQIAAELRLINDDEKVVVSYKGASTWIVRHLRRGVLNSTTEYDEGSKAMSRALTMFGWGPLNQTVEESAAKTLGLKD
jgi:hypothetical protein